METRLVIIIIIIIIIIIVVIVGLVIVKHGDLPFPTAPPTCGCNIPLAHDAQLAVILFCLRDRNEYNPQNDLNNRRNYCDPEEQLKTT